MWSKYGAEFVRGQIKEHTYLGKEGKSGNTSRNCTLEQYETDALKLLGLAIKLIIRGGTNMLKAGTKAPAFSLPDQNGKVHTLEEYRGKKVILYFYPKDNTPGCTKQACNFGELYPQFREKGAVVLGVSKDSVASHKKFEEKYGLPFTLLSDPELSCIQAYDVWQEKKNYGKVSMGVVRTTYLIDEEGTIIKAFGKVKAAENPAQMLEELQE